MKHNIERARDLANFREEIAALQRDEQARRQTGHFLRVEKFDPQELTWEDAEIWRKVKENSITEPEFHAYRASVTAAEGARPGDYKHASTRHTFEQFIASRASDIFLRRSAEERKKKAGASE